MAVDTAIKRRSALYFVGHRKGRLIPDSIISAGDFSDIVGFYRAITHALFVVVLDSVSVTQPTITASVTQPEIAVSVTQPTITITEKNDIT